MSNLELSSPCPHCQRHARTLHHAQLRAVCAECGKPRLVIAHLNKTETPSALLNLQQAYSALSNARRLNALSLAVMLLALISGGIGVLFAANEPLTTSWRIVVAALSLLPAVIALSLRRRQRAAHDSVSVLLDVGLADALHDWLRQDGPKPTATEVASAAGVSESRAARLLAEAEIDEYLAT